MEVGSFRGCRSKSSEVIISPAHPSRSAVHFKPKTQLLSQAEPAAHTNADTPAQCDPQTSFCFWLPVFNQTGIYVLSTAGLMAVNRHYIFSWMQRLNRLDA